MVQHEALDDEMERLRIRFGMVGCDVLRNTSKDFAVVDGIGPAGGLGHAECLQAHFARGDPRQLAARSRPPFARNSRRWHAILFVDRNGWETDVASEHGQRKIAAILIADVVGYSRLAGGRTRIARLAQTSWRCVAI